MIFKKVNNDKKEYAVVDGDGEVVMYFRLKMAAKYWIHANKKDYFGGELKIIKNDNL
jgi:hypothetical protein